MHLRPSNGLSNVASLGMNVNLIGPATAVDVCVQPGDVILGDARLLHAAHPNHSAERRTGITLWYIAGWAQVHCIPLRCVWD